MSYLILGLVLFIAFSVGLNLGLHGVINVHGMGPVASQRGGKESKGQQGASTTPQQGIGDSVGVAEKVPGDNVPLVKRTTPQQNTIKKDRGRASRMPSSNTEQKHQQQPPAATITPARGSIHQAPPVPNDESPRNARILSDEACSTQSYLDVVKRTSASLENEKTHISSRDDISSYIDTGGKIPVVMMTCNRAALLKTTLASLFSVKGMTKDNVVVLQDGKNQEVEAVVRDHGLQLHQHEPTQLRYADGATRIAKHYKYSLTTAFNHFPRAPAVIVVEDDLLFSPDFLDYFEQVAPILDVDATSFLVSAWSDNGYKGKVDDPYALRRTEFFPGLGWLLPRKLYKQELEDKWPSEHWDHWLRSYPVNKGREIIYPQVPRTYHNGIKGTFMDMGTHNRYFRDIAYNQDRHMSWKEHIAVSLSGVSVMPTADRDSSSNGGLAIPVYTQAVDAVYEERIVALVSKCTHLRSAKDLATTTGIICIWLDVPPEGRGGRPPPFEPLAKFFGLWHEHNRGVHKGLHEFYFGAKASQYILVLNTFEGPVGGGGGGRKGRGRSYKYLKPAGATLLLPSDFTPDLKHSLEQAHNLQSLEANGVKIIGASRVGQSCREVCAEDGGMQCEETRLALANSCPALKSVFSCNGGCSESMGSEQPAMEKRSLKCLYTSNIAASTCDASHKYTLRACPCKKKND